jgi:hypothetical protein
LLDLLGDSTARGGSHGHDALDEFLLETGGSSSTNALLGPFLQILRQAATGISSSLSPR